jgi:hypothetical protein
MMGNIIPLAVGDIGLPVDTGFAPFDVRYLPTPRRLILSLFFLQTNAGESQSNLIALFSESVIAFYPEVRVK